jgi:hypothetical protein
VVEPDFTIRVEGYRQPDGSFALSVDGCEVTTTDDRDAWEPIVGGSVIGAIKGELDGLAVQAEHRAC